MGILDKIMRRPAPSAHIPGERDAPPGQRVHSEYFVGEPQDGLVHWNARVYGADFQAIENSGARPTEDEAHRDAQDWCARKKHEMRSKQ
jgi:hypothetical protein